VTHNRAMLTRDQLAELLHTVNVEDLAREAGVATKTIYRLRHKENSPNLETVESILAAIARMKPKRRKTEAA
jgi:DNA-binding phage protein